MTQPRTLGHGPISMSQPALPAPAGEPETPGPLQASMVSFEVVYEQYADLVWRNARRLGVAEGALDDIVQEVFVVAHRRLESIQSRETLRAWLFSILVRVVRNHLRGLRRKDPHQRSTSATVDPELVPASSRCNPGAVAELTDAARILHALLLELPEERREVFVLAEVEEMPVAEISKVLGCNPNTIQSRLRVARKEFNEAVQRYRARDEWRLR